MKFLEKKIPPLIVFIAVVILMRFVSLNFSYIVFKNDFFKIAGIIFAVVGLFIPLYGVYLFRKNKTTVDPINLDKTKELVTTGIYRYSRNPMYLGFFFVLFGWGLFLGDESIVLSFLFPFYLNWFQIRPEERELEKIFGVEYEAYKSQVGRWFII